MNFDAFLEVLTTLFKNRALKTLSQNLKILFMKFFFNLTSDPSTVGVIWHQGGFRRR